MSAGLIHCVFDAPMDRRWTQQGAACPRRGCSGTLRHQERAKSAHEGHAQDPELAVALRPSALDYYDSAACDQQHASHRLLGPEHRHVALGEFGGFWSCDRCSNRRGLIHQADLGVCAGGVR